MQSPDILVIDVNGLGFAAMYQPNLANLKHEGFHTGGIHGALASVFMRMTEIPEAVPIVVWDGRARWRKELYPEYKSNRADHPDKIAIRNLYIAQVPYIQLILNRIGIPQIRCASAEADDLAGIISREIDPSWNIERNSKDHDYWQGLKSNVSWYSSTAKKSMTLASLADPNADHKDGHFLSTDEYIEAKAFSGDTSDAIKGVTGIGLKTASKIMREYGGSAQAFFDKVDSGITPKGVKAASMATAETREMFARNMKLMDWRLAPEMNTGDLTITAGKPDWVEVEALTEQFGLKRTLSKAKALIGTGRHWGAALDAVHAALHHRTVQPVVKPEHWSALGA